MSLYQNLRELGKSGLVEVTLYLENGKEVYTGGWPGSRVKNLNMFLDELCQYAREQEGNDDIVKIKVDNYVISFE